MTYYGVNGLPLHDHSKDSKKCKYCRVEIAITDTKCWHCKRRQGIGIYILVVVILLILYCATTVCVNNAGAIARGEKAGIIHKN